MSKYEAVLVLSVKNGDEATQSLQEKFKALIEANGTLESVDEWGKRKLAYEIEKQREGFYYFIQFQAEATTPAEIESRVRIMEQVLRYLIVSLEDK